MNSTIDSVLGEILKCGIIPMKATQQHFLVQLFSVLFKVPITFESSLESSFDQWYCLS